MNRHPYHTKNPKMKANKKDTYWEMSSLSVYLIVFYELYLVHL